MGGNGQLDGVFVPTGGSVDTGSLVREEALVVPARLARVRKSDVAAFLEIDEATSQLLGWSAEEMVGRRSFEFIHPDDQELAVENWMQMLASPGLAHKVRMRHRCRDGSWIWLEINNHNLLDDPAYNCVVTDMVDISEEMAIHESLPAGEQSPDVDPQLTYRPRRLDQALRAREQLLHRLAEALPLGVLQVDARGRIVYTNRRLHSILGVARAGTVEGQLATVLPGDRELVEEAFEEVLRNGLDNDIEMSLATSDANGVEDVRQCTMSLRALTGHAGEVTGAIACVADVTESVRMREELRVRATFDEVTRCYNRVSTMESLEMTLAASKAGIRPAVIFVDLDRFKEVNDQWGHAAGDAMLEIVARRLLRAVRRRDLVGRIGGDEFLIVCPGITAASQAMRAATRVADTLQHSVRLNKVQVPCQASIGVAWSAGREADADTLVSQADAAMYEAKREGSGRPVLYSGSLAVGDSRDSGTEGLVDSPHSLK
ncbi:MAG: diguanylate cyclase [Acidimicrobiales bacterium]